MPNPLKAKLAAGGCIICNWMVLGSISVAELMARSGADALVFDLQHGLWQRASLEHGIGLVRPHIVPVARPSDDSYHAIGSTLDAGAQAVIVPMVETEDQALAIAKAARFPPLGGRSVGGPRPIADYATYVPSANADILVAAMIETEMGVRNARAIAKVEGIDLLFIGPFDLSLSLGTFPKFGPKHDTAVQSVLEASRDAGKFCGIYTPNATVARERMAQGFQWVVAADDQNLIQGPAEEAVKRARGAA
jgi:2-keto-3-deoxy-L-rhamnonate aldolase RhmA